MKPFFLFLIYLLGGWAAMLPAAADVPVYVWQHWNDSTSEESLERDFHILRTHQVKGVCFNAGFQTERIALAARVAKREGLEFHAWAPAMMQPDCDSTWYAVNRHGESAYRRPAYVPYYTTLDPHNPQVVHWLCEQYARVAAIPEVDYVQLDYIRYADVILAEGLWKKYGLVMHEEYPLADYCYCDDCVEDFRRQTGIDIRAVSDPSKVQEWAQFRCDNVTRCVNAICAAVHAQGKRVSADVFPGPKRHAERMVRQQWDRWHVDAYFPMNYNDFYLRPAFWVGEVTREEVEAVRARWGQPVYSGLFICRDWRNKANVVDPENSGLTPDELREAVEGALRAGARGISLFSAESMTPEHWKALSETLERWHR